MYKYYIKLTLTCKLTSSQVKIQTNTQNLFIFYSIIKVITLSKRNSYGFGYVGHSFSKMSLCLFGANVFGQNKLHVRHDFNSQIQHKNKNTHECFLTCTQIYIKIFAIIFILCIPLKG